MYNPEKLVTQGTQEEDNKTKTENNMCWTPIYENKYKSRK